MKLNYITTPYDFLMQAIKILYSNNQINEEINLTYNFVILTEIDTLKKYNKKCIISLYENNLELFIDIIDKLIILYENDEDYEKCLKLLDKKIITKKVLNDDI